MAFVARVSRWTASSLRRSGEGASRFPVAVIAICAFSVLSNVAVAGRFEQDDVLFRSLAALSGAAAFSVATSLFLEGRGAAPTIRFLLSTLAAILVGSAIGWSEPFSVYAPALLLASIAAVPLAPFVARGSSQDFWIFTLWNAVGVVLSFATVLLFCLGAQAVLEMIRYLFQISFFERLDRHLYTVATTLVGPVFALGRIPSLRDEPVPFDGKDRLVAALRSLFEWVQAPLVLATAAVLHIYVARIVLTGEIPRNQVGWIVSTYGFLLLNVRFALDPFRETLSAPARFVMRAWAGLALVPLGLLALAIARRVGPEGFTVERYYLALWWISLVICFLLQVLPRMRGDIRVLLAVPVALLALSTVGPWGVAATVGRSQAELIQQEFPAFLEATSRAPAVLESGAASRLQSRLRAMDEVRELGRLRSDLASVASRDPAWAADEPDFATIQSSLIAVAPSAAERPVYSRAYQGTIAPLDLQGYDKALLALSVNDPNPSGAIGLIEEGSTLEIRYAGKIDQLDLSANLPATFSASNIQPSDRAPADLDLRTRANREVRLRIERLVWDTELGDEAAVSVQLVSAVVLLRSAEWAE